MKIKTPLSETFGEEGFTPYDVFSHNMWDDSAHLMPPFHVDKGLPLFPDVSAKVEQGSEGDGGIKACCQLVGTGLIRRQIVFFLSFVFQTDVLSRWQDVV